MQQAVYNISYLSYLRNVHAQFVARTDVEKFTLTAV
jgi:hypothetical protein